MAQTMTPTERSAVLAGLRLLQRALTGLDRLLVDIEAIASDSGETITPERIDDLCEWINQ